jgi:hypothetical protein
MCGAQHAACGAASDSVPVDERMEVAVVGGPLKKYNVSTPSGVETTMKLNQEDAKRLGVLEGAETEASTEADSEPAEAPTKARTTTRNKARTAAATKDGGTGGGD